MPDSTPPSLMPPDPAVLLEPAPASLAGWYATPLPVAAAAALLERAQAVSQLRLREGGDAGQVRLLILLCRFWLGADARHEYAEQIVTCSDQRARALQELVTGQLLVSRKLSDAGRYLERGFRQAAGLLSNSDYFHVLRRHELLGRLPLSETPSPAQNLPELLVEAAVIGRIMQAGRRRLSATHLDTVD